MEVVQTHRDGPLLPMDVQAPSHALHDCQRMLVVQHQLHR